MLESHSTRCKTRAAPLPSARVGTRWIVLQQLASSHPDEVRRYELDYHMTNEKLPWHRHGTDKHKGRFGHMGECLDCLEELKKGRCTVDVTQFDYRWYWTVKRFWDQVDVRGEDECWPWLGATKKGGTESVALPISGPLWSYTISNARCILVEPGICR